MDTLEDRTKFLAADSTRLEIACWCSAEPLSRGDIADRLKRPSGSISAPDTMLRRGTLVDAGHRTSGGPGLGAQLLKLNPRWHKAMQHALDARLPARLEPGADLFLIPLTSLLSACEVLAGGEEGIRWGVRLEGEQVGLLLSPTRTPDDGASIRLASALGRVGINPVRVRMQTPMSAGELQKWAVSVISGGRRRLESGANEPAS